MVKFPEPLKEWNRQRAATLMEDLDILLGDLCVIWGFCNGLTGWELTQSGETITADNFARAVLAAEQESPSEGIDLAGTTVWHQKIRTVFVERYGEKVSPSTFRGL